MKRKNFFFYLVAMLFVSPITIAAGGFKINFASALEVSLPGLSPSPTLPEYAAYFFNIGIATTSILSVAVIALGGIYYLASFSRGKITTEGNEWVKAGVRGLIISLCIYLLAYTINPALLLFKLPGLNLIIPSLPQSSDKNNEGFTEIVYQEIPIGTLTETLLTKTMSCYDFDPEGNPIKGDQIRTDDTKNAKGKTIPGVVMIGPTYMDHDRVDCLLKLMDAAQKKAKIISDLSREIKKLMETCNCDGKCKDPCNEGGHGCQLAGAGCAGACKGNSGKGAACSQPENSESCCEPDTKEKIEHGLISVGGENDDSQCNNPAKEYKGLDEFRTKLSSIADLIEIKAKVNKKDVAVINITGNEGVQTNEGVKPERRWNGLKLIEQLMYLKEKIKEIEDDIKNDINKLDSARAAVANCYTVKSSVDFLKIKESIKKEDKKVVLSIPWNDVDSSKYCEGFNYSNSSCYKLCSNMCPDTTQDVVKCYKGCIEKKCDPEDKDCFNKQQDCVSKCYDSRACIFQASSNKKSAGTFKECISNCRQDCSDFCSKAYLLCSEEYKFCKSQCDNNSKCILENKNTCLFNSQAMNTDDFRNCISKDDYSNVKNCINNSYLCKYGSDEYAGYPDCTNGYTGCSQNSIYLKNEEYSSPYIFENKDAQRCQDPYATCQEGKNVGRTCLELYPETSKCPSNSFCPDCPCGEINEKIKFTTDSPIVEDGGAGGNGGLEPLYIGGWIKKPDSPTSISIKISAHDLVTGECNEFLYNTDPLTFYCATNWQQENFISCQGFGCSKADEIPVGQAVDDAKKWANNLLSMTDSFLNSLTDILSNSKKINDKKENEYCRCDSKYDMSATNGDKSGQPICTSNCQYNPPILMDFGGTGNPIFSNPSCSVILCNGDSCQQMINYLIQIVNSYIQMRTAFINLYVDFLKEPRTDPLKELSYSRDGINSCSKNMVQLGKDNVKTLSCSRAYPGTSCVGKRCYGILNGLVQNPKIDSTDNWFCCQKFNIQ